eukprot:2063251-Amphidinium_carterae.1
MQCLLLLGCEFLEHGLQQLNQDGIVLGSAYLLAQSLLAERVSCLVLVAALTGLCRLSSSL